MHTYIHAYVVQVRDIMEFLAPKMMVGNPLSRDPDVIVSMCMHVCVYGMHVHLYVCVTSEYVLMYACMRVCMYVCVYVLCAHVYMHACMRVCVYA